MSISVLGAGAFGTAVAAILDTPPEWSFVGYLCIGYPVGECDTPALQREGWESRKPPSDTVFYR